MLIDRFVKKVYELDPSTTGIPWQPRGYTSKRKNMESYSAETIPKKICTPLIDEEVGESKFLPPGFSCSKAISTNPGLDTMTNHYALFVKP